MDLGCIEERHIRHALGSWLSTGRVGDSPLLNLNIVAQRLRRETVTINDEVRQWALAEVITDVTHAHLVRLHSGRPYAEPTAPEHVAAMILADFRADSADLEAWSCLYHRYLSPFPQHVQELAAIVQPGAPNGRKLIARRLERGYALLANALRAAERAARAAGVDTAAVNPVRPLDHIAQHLPGDERAYRLSRIAEWSQPRYRLDTRFVRLMLLVDQGVEATAGRWKAITQRFGDLGEILAAVPEPALVVLGPPGSGKSTLLRHYELDTAMAALRGEDARDMLTFFVQLNQYKPTEPGQAVPSPERWLATRWAAAYPDLPPLDTLLVGGRVVLLLDALNEMPAASEHALRAQVGMWKDWLVRLARDAPGNRVVFSCRTLDYSAPLSTPELRVPQVRIEPLADDQVAELLRSYSPERGEEIWANLVNTPQLEAVRAPFFLALLVDHVEATGTMPGDLAALFTGYVRQALRREAERDNPLFALEELLSSRDMRRIAQGQWRDEYDLPERGALVPRLSALAYGMQVTNAVGEQCQVRVDYDAALCVLEHPRAADIVGAGVAISVLDEDPASDEVLFRHQLLQEYFAARLLAREPRPERVATPWRSADIRPGLRDVLDALPPAEALPALPTTGWEETMVLATAMVAQPEPFLRALLPHNLAVAGRAANLPTVRARMCAAFLDEVRWALVDRSRDPAADLRARIDAGLALGWLGDPRYAQRSGPQGAYLVPPLTCVPAGVYPIGDDDPIVEHGGVRSHNMPRHTTRLAPFSIGRFPVTNAEWSLFMTAGGYEDARWWDTSMALAWQRGEATAAGIHASVRLQLKIYRDAPEVLQALWTSGTWSDEVYERYRRRLAMSEDELAAHLWELYPGGKVRQPAFWRDERYNNPSQPVVGVCWFESRAFCRWLAAQTGWVCRLPSEVEHEAAQRGHAGRRWSFGDTFDALRCNTVETRLKRPSPVGVFVEGDTPEGASDLCGNVEEWTSSLFSASRDAVPFSYPYDALDGREAVEAGMDAVRVVRGGSWHNGPGGARSACRDTNFPGARSNVVGFRLVVEPSP